MTWLRAHLADLALVALVLAMAGPIVQDLDAQQSSRLGLTAAVWDDGTLRLDEYPIGVDRAEHDGHVYSDKAPGQPFFAIPAYALYRAVGGEPAKVLRYEGNLGLWSVTLWSSVLPVALLLLLVRRAAEDVTPGAGLPVAVLTYVATMLLPFSSVLFGHGLSTCLAFAGWFVVRRGAPSNGALFACGALLGAATLVEFTMILPAAVIALALLREVGPRVWRFVAGGLPALGAMLLYGWAAFGNPFTFTYARSSFGEASKSLGDQPQDPPLLENAVKVLVGERGLFVVTPIVLLSAIGIVVLIQRTEAPRRVWYLAAAVSAASLVAVQMAWSNPTGGDSPGPRYATAAAAFLSPGLAVAAARWPRWVRITGALGAAVMLAATWTNPLEARDSTSAIGLWFEQLLEGDWALTVYEMATTRAVGMVLLAVVSVAAVAALVAASREPEPG